ncbi:MAG: Fic family protein [Chloroflexi bacterium]|nr:Fic family protein [Chloroflexota bacterium]
MKDLSNSPIGYLVQVEEGQSAFVPYDLPRQVVLSPALIHVLSQADLAVGTLAGVGETLPNPHLLIAPFLRREAVLSSKIEGTQASISDLFRFEASDKGGATGDVREVANYVRALEEGQRLLEELPMCVRLANRVHERLLEGVRGKDARPGEPRPRQVWIGAPGTPIHEARFIPPPARFVPELLADWERFVNEDFEMPSLVQCALMHYQLEAIHPYIDGNGRIGRLMIILLLCAKRVLLTPLLYLSAYFERNQEAYYDHLLDVSATGNWEPWLRFFLEGVNQEARDALIRSRKVRTLYEWQRHSLQDKRESSNALRLLERLFNNPYITAPAAVAFLGVTHPGAMRILERLVEAKTIEQVGDFWPRLFVDRELLEVLEA